MGLRLAHFAGWTAALAIATIAAAFAEARAFRVTRHRVVLSAASDDAGCLRVLHVGDTHYRRGEHAKAKFLASLAALQPDLVVMTGDMVANDAGIDECLAAMAGLLRLPGVFVFGSNDFHASRPVNPLAYLVSGVRDPAGQATPRQPVDWQRLRDALTAAGWCDLNNRWTRLEAGGTTIELRGAGDAHICQDAYAGVAASRPRDDQTPAIVIGVTHAPYRRVLDAMVADEVPLVLAGHTHGGQICLPVYGAILTNCDLSTSMAKGLHRWSDAGWLHVTAGVGASPHFPLRTFCRPEACLLEVIP